jgi:uncharacterized protein YkwD
VAVDCNYYISRNLLSKLVSGNNAAQVHAEDMLKTGYLSHWMTGGEKSYMVYTRYGSDGGGMSGGAVSQNAAM